MDSHDARAAVQRLTRDDAGTADVAIVLGSGLGNALQAHITGSDVPYDELPGFPIPSVAGHPGIARIGTIGKRRVVAFCGRFHSYEGHAAQAVVTPIALAHALGARVVVLTNAAGGLDPGLASGDLVAISDHLNLTGMSPLPVPRAQSAGETRFVDLTDAYDPLLRSRLYTVAHAERIALREGIYAGVPGPAYETPAEATMLRRLGADLVGMSTVLETIAARAYGMRVLGISLITNVHGEATRTTHDDVLLASGQGAERLARLIAAFVSSE